MDVVDVIIQNGDRQVWWSSVGLAKAETEIDGTHMMGRHVGMSKTTGDMSRRDGVHVHCETGASQKSSGTKIRKFLF